MRPVSPLFENSPNQVSTLMKASKMPFLRLDYESSADSTKSTCSSASIPTVTACSAVVASQRSRTGQVAGASQ